MKNVDNAKKNVELYTSIKITLEQFIQLVNDDYENIDIYFALFEYPQDVLVINKLHVLKNSKECAKLFGMYQIAPSVLPLILMVAEQLIVTCVIAKSGLSNFKWNEDSESIWISTFSKVPGFVEKLKDTKSKFLKKINAI